MYPVLFTLPGGKDVFSYGVMLGLSCVIGAHLAVYLSRRSAIEEKLHEMPSTVIEAETKSIDQLRRLAARNQRLLKAYLDGARRATRRLGLIEESQGKIGAYKADGSRVSSANARSTKQQRA